MTRFLTIFTVTLLLFSCKKDEMPDVVESNDPIFTVKGTIGQEAVEVIAGDNNQYMFTDFDVRKGVNLFYGNIKNDNSSFKLTIHDGNLDNDKLEQITNKPSFNITRSSPTPLFQYAIDSFANNIKISNVDWYVDGQFHSSDNISLYDHGIYDVCAEVTFYDGETVELCNQVILGYKKHAIGQAVHIISSTGRLSVYNNTTYLVDNVKWYVDDQFVTDNNELTTSDYSGIVTITVDVQYSNGSTRRKSIVVDFDQDGRFVQDFSFAENVNPLDNDYSMDIRVNIDGEIWVSNIPENDNVQILIDKYQKYKNNLNGIPVSIAIGTLECKLKRLSDGTIRDADLDITFGFPENF